VGNMTKPRLQLVERLRVAALALLDAPDEAAQQALDRVLVGRGRVAAAFRGGAARLPTHFRSHPAPLAKMMPCSMGLRGVGLRGRHATERSPPPWQVGVNFGLSRAPIWDISAKIVGPCQAFAAGRP